MIRWAGTSFRFHPLFIVVMLGSAATGHFLELIVLFGIVFIHELGHVAAAKSFGWKVTEVKLLPFGGVAVVDDYGNISAREECLVAIAGPLQNAWMAGFGLAMQKFGVWEPEWAAYFVRANVMIGAFNLIPAMPLDGGKIMKAMFSQTMPFYRAAWMSSIVSLSLSLGIFIVSALPIYGQGVQLNLLVIGLFLLYANWHDHRNLPFSFLRFLTNRGARTRTFIRGGTLAQPIVISDKRSVSHTVKLFMRDKYHLIYVMNDKGYIRAVLPEQQLLHAFFVDNKPGSAVSELFMIK